MAQPGERQQRGHQWIERFFRRHQLLRAKLLGQGCQFVAQIVQHALGVGGEQFFHFLAGLQHGAQAAHHRARTRGIQHHGFQFAFGRCEGRVRHREARQGMGHPGHRAQQDATRALRQRLDPVELEEQGAQQAQGRLAALGVTAHPEQVFDYPAGQHAALRRRAGRGRFPPQGELFLGFRGKHPGVLAVGAGKVGDDPDRWRARCG